MAKNLSKNARWQAAAAKAETFARDVRDALEELDSIRQEYEEWRDGMPENMQSSATYDKLETICDLDLMSAMDDLDEIIDEAANADLPLGFGRD